MLRNNIDNNDVDDNEMNDKVEDVIVNISATGTTP